MNAHVHDITIEAALLTSPPAGDTTKNSTVVSAHSHSVTLSQAELTSINNGTAVTKTSTSAGTPAHEHTFTFQKV